MWGHKEAHHVHELAEVILLDDGLHVALLVDCRCVPNASPVVLVSHSLQTKVPRSRRPMVTEGIITEGIGTESIVRWQLWGGRELAVSIVSEQHLSTGCCIPCATPSTRGRDSSRHGRTQSARQSDSPGGAVHRHARELLWQGQSHAKSPVQACAAAGCVVLCQHAPSFPCPSAGPSRPGCQTSWLCRCASPCWLNTCIGTQNNFTPWRAGLRCGSKHFGDAT